MKAEKMNKSVIRFFSYRILKFIYKILDKTDFFFKSSALTPHIHMVFKMAAFTFNLAACLVFYLFLYTAS